MSEVWKDVVGYEGCYQVSSAGGFRSLVWWKAAVIHPNITATPGTPWEIDCEIDKAGYRTAQLSKNAIGKTRRLHALILEAFVGPRRVGMFGLHNDGNRLNNAVDNLRWGTPKENSEDMVRHGTQCRGARCHAARLTELDVLRIKQDLLATHTDVAISEMYGVSNVAIGKIRKGRTWKHVGSISNPRSPGRIYLRGISKKGGARRGAEGNTESHEVCFV